MKMENTIIIILIIVIHQRKKEYDKMKKWYDALQGKISGMNEAISASTSCLIPPKHASASKWAKMYGHRFHQVPTFP